MGKNQLSDRIAFLRIEASARMPQGIEGFSVLGSWVAVWHGREFHVDDRAGPADPPAASRHAAITQGADLLATPDGLPGAYDDVLKMAIDGIPVKWRMVNGYGVSASLRIGADMGDDRSVGRRDNVLAERPREIDAGMRHLPVWKRAATATARFVGGGHRRARLRATRKQHQHARARRSAYDPWRRIHSRLQRHPRISAFHPATPGEVLERKLKLSQCRRRSQIHFSVAATSISPLAGMNGRCRIGSCGLRCFREVGAGGTAIRAVVEIIFEFKGVGVISLFSRVHI